MFPWHIIIYTSTVLNTWHLKWRVARSLRKLFACFNFKLEANFQLATDGGITINESCKLTNSFQSFGIKTPPRCRAIHTFHWETLWGCRLLIKDLNFGPVGLPTAFDNIPYRWTFNNKSAGLLPKVATHPTERKSSIVRFEERKLPRNASGSPARCINLLSAENRSQWSISITNIFDKLWRIDYCMIKPYNKCNVVVKFAIQNSPYCLWSLNLTSSLALCCENYHIFYIYFIALVYFIKYRLKQKNTNHSLILLMDMRKRITVKCLELDYF